MKDKGYLIILVILLLVTTLAIGCESKETGLETGLEMEEGQGLAEASPVEGGQIILPLTTFNTLNPLKTENKSYYHFSKLIFEGLFEFDSNLNVKEQLVETYEIQDRGKTVKIKLKDDVLWHNGEKLTSEDVEFTINTIKHAGNNSPYGEMFFEALGNYGGFDIRRIINTSVIDDRNMVINFDREFSNNLEVLTFPIISKNLFTRTNRDVNNFANALAVDNYQVVGTGPFKFKSYEKKKEVTLESNDTYREGKPYIDTIIGRVIGTDADILTAFETGQINLATTVGVDWDKYSKNNRINILEYISSNYEFLGFNFSKEIFAGENGRTLRRAIAYGIDRQNIIETAYLGHGTQIDVPIHPNSWLISDESNSFGYNLDEAKRELKKLGWEDRDGDGILEDGNGKQISLNLLTNSYNSIRLKTAEMIKKDLSKLGIIVNLKYDSSIENMGKDDIESQWMGIENDLIRGNYDMVLLGWELSAIPDLSFAFHSSQISTNRNLIKYSSGEMDGVLQEAFLAGTRDGKIKSYQKLQELIVQDLPYVSLFFKNKALLIDSKIVGELNPNFLNPYKGIEKSYIPKKLQ